MVYLRLDSWRCMFKDFEQMYNLMFPPLLYHTPPFAALTPWSTPASPSLQTPDTHWSIYRLHQRLWIFTLVLIVWLVVCVVTMKKLAVIPLRDEGTAERPLLTSYTQIQTSPITEGGFASADLQCKRLSGDREEAPISKKNEKDNDMWLLMDPNTWFFSHFHWDVIGT